MLNLLLTAAAFLPQGPGISTAPVVINEFSYDDAGTDLLEFVELYNRSGGPIDISGWMIRNPDATGPTYGTAPNNNGVDLLYTIPPNTMLPAGGFYVLGSATVLGVNQVIGTTNLLENDNEAIELLDSTSALIDSVAYELGLGNFGPHPAEGRGFFGDLAVGDASGAPTSSIARLIDGYDNDDNGSDFACCMRPTPGASNNVANNAAYFDVFDTGTAGGFVTDWRVGFVGARYTDPTSISPQNPSAKPASPQGGLAMSTWDPTGGGNTVALDRGPMADVVVETYVWIEPLMSPVNPAGYTPVPPVMLDNYNIGDGEWWCVGVRGSVAANGNPPNVGNYFGTIGLGVGTRYHFATGIAWAHFRTPTYSSLYLLDFGNGAAVGNPNVTVLAGPIPIVASVNDGWQRIRLHVQGTDVIANFGGTFGFDDGLRIAATTATTAIGGVYVGYREAVLYNTNGLAGCHPPLFDLFDVHAPTTSRSIYGVASPTTVGTPMIGSNGLAIVGSTGFAITGTGLVPLGSPNFAFCACAFAFGSLPSGYPIPGAPPTVLAYPLPILTATIGFANSSGAVNFPFALPPTAAYNGIPIVAQLIDFDPLLPYSAPIGTSQGMDCVIGN